MKITLLICFTLILTLLFSCSTEDSQKSKTDLLTESTWIFDYFVIDLNNNLIPDDEKGNSQDLKIKFNKDGTLAYTFKGILQNGTWNFEFDETVITFFGIEIDNLISSSNEFSSSIYRLDETNLIFQGASVNNPEQLYFEVFKK